MNYNVFYGYSNYNIVSVVRLYQAKDDTNEVAEPVGEYPNEDSTLPIGMTEKEFQNVKTLLSQED